MRDADTIVHANAYHMATAIENTADAIARIKAAGSEITAIKRLGCPLQRRLKQKYRKQPHAK
jgi:hypothetical protein